MFKTVILDQISTACVLV